MNLFQWFLQNQNLNQDQFMPLMKSCCKEEAIAAVPVSKFSWDQENGAYLPL